ncbi:MAG: hypothetical protein ACREMA_08165 [Longimicrobiales bacterium]
MLINVTGLPTELRSAHPRSGNSSGVADYLCDGCRERLFLTGKLTREAWVKYFNAPAELVAKMRALDSALGRRR